MFDLATTAGRKSTYVIRLLADGRTELEGFVTFTDTSRQNIYMPLGIFARAK